MAAGDALGRQFVTRASPREPEYPTTGRPGRKVAAPQLAATRMTKTGRWDARLEATRKGVTPSAN